MMNRSVKDGLVPGTTLLVIHSFASSLVFLYCHINTEGQSVFVYFLFFVVDAPTVLPVGIVLRPSQHHSSDSIGLTVWLEAFQ